MEPQGPTHGPLWPRPPGEPSSYQKLSSDAADFLSTPHTGAPFLAWIPPGWSKWAWPCSGQRGGAPTQEVATPALNPAHIPGVSCRWRDAREKEFHHTHTHTSCFCTTFLVPSLAADRRKQSHRPCWQHLKTLIRPFKVLYR